VQTDHIEPYVRADWKPEDIRIFKRAWAHALLQSRKVPLIIEGTHLITEAECVHESPTARISLGFLSELCKSTNAIGVVVGAAEDDPMVKFEALERTLYSCWTRRRSRRERWRIARHVVYLSKELRREAQKTNIPFRSIRGEAFREDIDALSHELTDWLTTGSHVSR